MKAPNSLDNKGILLTTSYLLRTQKKLPIPGKPQTIKTYPR